MRKAGVTAALFRAMDWIEHVQVEKSELCRNLNATLNELDRANKEAFAALAELEARGPSIDPGALLGVKDWLYEQKLLISQAKEMLKGQR
jgi:hypothetical protein